MSQRIRVFITTSHISCVYMTLHARSTRSAGVRDVLLVDAGQRTGVLIHLIQEVASMHDWSLVHDFSDHVTTDHRFEPGVFKRLTRRWKEAPLARNIYGALLKRHLHKRDAAYRVRLRDLLRDVIKPTEEVVIYAHTQSPISEPLRLEFPQARLSFFEHGLGDYHYIVDQGQLRGPFRALFAEGFKRFLELRGIPSDQVLPLTLPVDYPQLASELMRKHGAPTDKSRPAEKPFVFVLLEAVDMYEVPEQFWGAYIDHLIGALDHPERYHYLLKPHPTQSAVSFRATEARFRGLGLSYTLLDDPADRGIAAEVLFARWSASTEHVFCLFSSACFYLSQLYRDPHITYHYSTTFMEKWTGNAPPMFKRHFDALKPLIEEVFAERCQPY